MNAEALDVINRITAERMSKQRQPRRHHYFPQFHLEYFEAETGRVWVYDKLGRLSPNPKLIGIPAVAFEAHLYSEDADGQPDATTEKWLAEHIDTRAAPVIARVVKNETLSPADRATLGRYVIARDLRTPSARDFLIDDAQGSIEAFYREHFADLAAAREQIRIQTGVDIQEDELRILVDAHSPVVTKGLWLDFVQRQVQQALPRLLAKGWSLFHAEQGCEFVSSDLGILKHAGSWENPVPNTPGWWTNGTGWLMPLTPTTLLAMAPQLKPIEKLAQRPYVERFNRSVAKYAREFVFARREADLLIAIDGADGR